MLLTRVHVFISSSRFTVLCTCRRWRAGFHRWASDQGGERDGGSVRRLRREPGADGGGEGEEPEQHRPADSGIRGVFHLLLTAQCTVLSPSLRTHITRAACVTDLVFIHSNTLLSGSNVQHVHFIIYLATFKFPVFSVPVSCVKMRVLHAQEILYQWKWYLCWSLQLILIWSCPGWEGVQTRSHAGGPWGSHGEDEHLELPDLWPGGQNRRGDGTDTQLC